jgi:1-acyl-sn-glycerol-3-phosphate acyltransferase
MKLVEWVIHIFQIIFRVFYKIYCLLLFVLSLLIAYPFFKILFFSKRGFPAAFKLMRFYAKFMHALFFLPVRLKKPMPDLPKGPFIICPNHGSFFDIPCIYYIFPSYFTFVGKKEIERWPLFRIFYTSGMNILVDRNEKSAAGISYKRMLHEIDLGHPLVIFPEGTITKNAPSLGEFKDGAFRIAVQKQIPILPVTFLSNYKRMERKGFFSGFASPGFCDVIIHEPVLTFGKSKADIPALKEQVKEIISKPLCDLN